MVGSDAFIEVEEASNYLNILLYSRGKKNAKMRFLVGPNMALTLATKKILWT